MEDIRVELGERSYHVRIGRGLIGKLGRLLHGDAPVRAAIRAVVIADSTVARLYGREAVASLTKAGIAASLLTFRAGESSKTLATYGRLMDRLLTLRPAIDRQTLIVGLGGGVTLDLAGFVAATALRGLPFVACPTTLLADVDAAIGGKTAVDHPAGKNLIGAFHQPRAVLIDVDSLATLPRRQFVNGLAECVKHAVIRDAKLLEFIERHAAAILARKPATLLRLIAWNVRIKAAVVSTDERESGERAHLNFGHTIGHAIEKLVGYDKIGHGEAVSLGMVAACDIAVRRGMLRAADANRIESALSRLGLPTRRPGLRPAAIWRIMQHDKKNLAGRVRMILPTRIGTVKIIDISERI